MAINLTPVQERSHLRALWKSGLLDATFTPLSEFLPAANKLAPSTVLGTGGLLFEAYLLRRSPQALYESLITAAQRQQPLPEDVVTKAIKVHGLAFWFSIVCAVKDMSSGYCQLNLYYWTLLRDYYGESRFGRMLSARVHIGMDNRTFDRRVTSSLKEHDQTVIKIMQGNLGVFTFDNFNHQYMNPRLSTQRDHQMSRANYTVMALSKFPHNVDNSYLVDSDGSPLCFSCC